MNNKAVTVISSICLAGILILSFISFYEVYKTSNYIKTTATITENIKDSKSSQHKYVEIKYDNYTNKYRVWTFIGKNKGENTTIYYSKDNPSVIRDKFKITNSLIGVAFLTAFVIVINFSKRTSKKLNSY